MSYISVDVESDGPIISQNSLVCFGAVLIDKEHKLDKTFYGQIKPVSDKFDPEALAISGFSREEHETFDDPSMIMWRFKDWMDEHGKGRAILVSDNNGYDASWINYYFMNYLGSNPFGWSSRRIGDMFAGFMNDPYYKWKKHRDSERFPHNHHPVSDACGNATALIYLKKQGFNIKFK